MTELIVFFFCNVSKAPNNYPGLVHLSAKPNARTPSNVKHCQTLSNCEQTNKGNPSLCTLAPAIYITATAIYGAYDRCHFEYLKH